MQTRFAKLLRVLFCGGLLFGSALPGCLADYLHDLADEIEDEDDFDEVINDIEDWLD
jgi:hypothetical protein